MVSDGRVAPGSADFDKIVGMLVVTEHCCRVAVFRFCAEEFLLITRQVFTISGELIVRLTAFFDVIDRL